MPHCHRIMWQRTTNETTLQKNKTACWGGKKHYTRKESNAVKVSRFEMQENVLKMNAIIISTNSIFLKNTEPTSKNMFYILIMN